MKRWISLAALLFSPLAPAGDFVVQKESSLPMTVIQVSFRTGSADDPPNQEGVAQLTAGLLREGGVKKLGPLPARTREQIEELLFPWGASISISVEKEQTVLRAVSPPEKASQIVGLLRQMLLAPSLDAQEFTRIRSATLDDIRHRLSQEDQEELGKAVLDRAIHSPGHPYSHPVPGTLKSLAALTVENVAAFHRTHFTRKRLSVAVGGVTKTAETELRRAFERLPSGSLTRPLVPRPPALTGRRLTIVEGPFSSTGIHLGHALPFTRADSDFPGMTLAEQAFGKHRSFVGRLMKKVRVIRGLNYGAYAYVEDFPHGGSLQSRPTGAARTRQAFTVWARPTPLENGCFLARMLIRELTRLRDHGLTREEFELAQSHLAGSAPLLATSLDERLGYELDSLFYGILGRFPQRLSQQARQVTEAQVQGLLKKHIDPDRLEIVVVTGSAEKFRAELLSPRCDIRYASGISVAPEVKAEDEEIAVFPPGIRPEAITIVQSNAAFQ